VYFAVGSARGAGGVALSSTLMETVPPHFMGRVQNTFYFGGLMLQLVLGVTVGYVAHAHSLSVAFAIVGTVFGVAFLTSIWPVEKSPVPPSGDSAEVLPQPTAEEARV
jgi:MFS family permease